ncbi:MAG: hypothetical protein JO125_01095 [Chloroflexi bacterium]|nr:hypothetical protein [Ktedonobacteraceae bacterium]MBV9019804.1 hypothetical protein [Ktedonobacteraceae bacterium]MBV9705984.1 hypothetical protein [Chloroflexota bacterium]
MAECKCFGTYGPYRVREDGSPEEADVFCDFIYRFGVERFGIEYGLLLRGNEYTRRRIEQMLHDKSFPTQAGRRWIIARLLHIPPVLLGLQSLDDLLTYQGQAQTLLTRAPSVSQRRNIDLTEFQVALGAYLNSWRACTVGDIVDEVMERIYHLHDRVLYVDKAQRLRMMEVLYGYHLLLATIARDYRYFSTAIVHINKALKLAKLIENRQLHAHALYKRGFIFFDRWETSTKQDHTDLRRAIGNYDAAWQVGGITIARGLLTSSISPHLAGAIALEGGHAHAHDIQEDAERKNAFKWMDLGGKAVDTHEFEGDMPLVRLTIQTYYNDMGSALVTTGDADEALRQLHYVDRGVDTQIRRQHAYTDIQLARVYLAKKYYPMATTLATNALMAVRDVNSGVNIARITHLYEDLKVTGYDEDREVTKLGIALMTVQRPDLFM